MACANSKLVASATPLPTDKNIHSTALKPLSLCSCYYVMQYVGVLFDQIIDWSDGFLCHLNDQMVHQLGRIS